MDIFSLAKFLQTKIRLKSIARFGGFFLFNITVE